MTPAGRKIFFRGWQLWTTVHFFPPHEEQDDFYGHTVDLGVVFLLTNAEYSDKVMVVTASTAWIDQPYLPGAANMTPI